MKNLLTTIALSFGLALGGTVAHADNITITTGAKGGSYHNKLGGNSRSVIREYGYQVNLLTSKGSIENLNRIAAAEADLGWTQADALMNWIEANPDKADSIDILAPLGKECVFVAVAENGKVQDEDDLGQKGINIAVQKRGSGAAVTWEYLRSLESSYAKANAHYKGGVRALGKLKQGQYDAVLWVTSPNNFNHKYLKAVNVKGSGLKIMDLNDYSLNNKLPNGDAVYSFEKIQATDGFFSSSYEVPCTDVLAVANADMDEEKLEALAEVFTMNANRISGGK